MNIAMEVSTSGDASRAKSLLKLLTRSYRELEMETINNYEETHNFFNMLAMLPLVQVKQLPKPWKDQHQNNDNVRSGDGDTLTKTAIPVVWGRDINQLNSINPNLYPLSSCCDYSDYDLCWSQVPVIGDSSLFLSSHLKKLLFSNNMNENENETSSLSSSSLLSNQLTPEIVAKHLLWISKQPISILLNMKYLDYTCQLCYNSLSKFITLNNNNDDIKNKIIDIFKDNPVILKKKISKTSLNNNNSNNSLFVHGSKVFAYLPYSLSPLALHVKIECNTFFNDIYTTSSTYGCNNLGKLLQIQLKPTPEHIQMWMQSFISYVRDCVFLYKYKSN